VTGKSAARVSWVLLIVLVAALATGAAASILVSATFGPPPPSGPVSLVYFPSWLISALSIGLIVFFLGSFVVWRLTAGPRSNLNRMAVSILMVVFLALLFVMGAHFFSAGGWIGPGGSTPPSGSSGSGHGTKPNITSPLNGSGGRIFYIPGLPAWVPFVILGAIVLVAVAIGVPRTRSYLADRRDKRALRRVSIPTVPAGMREALSRASSDLDLGGDPRVVILALYASMLEALRPMVDNLPTSTPEEIRAAHLVRLGVRPEAAGTLTRLFEEARYSEHPMGPTESAQAQEAVRATLDDLARRTSDE
jgi:hypothetical protein